MLLICEMTCRWKLENETLLELDKRCIACAAKVELSPGETSLWTLGVEQEIYRIRAAFFTVVSNESTHGFDNRPFQLLILGDSQQLKHTLGSILGCFFHDYTHLSLLSLFLSLSSVEAMITEIALEPGIVKSNPELHKNMSDKESTNTLLTAASSSNQMATEEDPLAHPEAINIVQQSDTTFVEDEETNNLSTFSIHHPLPCRNLCGAFDKMTEKIEEQLLLSHDGDDIRSPNGIEQFQSKDQYQYNIDLPNFDLHHDLRLDLSQSVIDRCSMYSVIHGINREVQDMAAHDQNCHADTTGEEVSPLVEAVNGKPKPSQKKTGPELELAVLDEEKFLLAVIASRNQEEMMIRDCPKTFSEAIGESDGTVVTDEGTSQTDNALSVVSASRTQLWKPGRSWWEAKSGKNPWIEPALHNKRWR